MTTEKILTNDEIMIEWEGTDNGLSFARAIEQAVLQSAEIQSLRKDAERYHWLRNRASTEGICVVHIDYWSEEYRGQAHCEVYDGEFLDKAIDAAMEQQT
ncbi:MAG: hypothetical protein WC340_15530 [Kiritimatiellia bacterium]